MTLSKVEKRKRIREQEKQIALEREISDTIAAIENYKYPTVKRSQFSNQPEIIPEDPKTYKEYLEEDKKRDNEYWNKKYNKR